MTDVVDLQGRRQSQGEPENLDALIERAQQIEMTPEQLRAQRQSFVYGNTHIDNPRVTRELVREVDEAAAQSGG